MFPGDFADFDLYSFRRCFSLQILAPSLPDYSHFPNTHILCVITDRIYFLSTNGELITALAQRRSPICPLRALCSGFEWLPAGIVEPAFGTSSSLKSCPVQ